MAVPQDRKAENLRLSINKWIADQFATPNSLTGKVSYQDRHFDATGLDLWVQVNFLSHGAGRKDLTLVQIDIRSETEGSIPGGDQYAANVDDLADKLHDALHVESIPIYDFSVDPESPVLQTKKKLLVQNSRGVKREPESDQEIPFEDGTARRSLVYRFRTLGDYAAGHYYD